MRLLKPNILDHSSSWQGHSWDLLLLPGGPDVKKSPCTSLHILAPMPSYWTDRNLHPRNPCHVACECGANFFRAAGRQLFPSMFIRGLLWLAIIFWAISYLPKAIQNYSKHFLHLWVSNRFTSRLTLRCKVALPLLGLAALCSTRSRRRSDRWQTASGKTSSKT